MVIITGVVSVTNLVIRATTFLADLPERWYKGDSQIKSFKVNIKVLSQTRAHWERQVKQYGMSEYPGLEDLLAETVKLLDAEEDKFENRKNDRFWMWKKRMFPSKLAHLLENLREVVEGGPQMLASSVEQKELLTKRFLTEPLPLPFGDDPKYVPLQEMVDEVQSALENKGGPQVMILYGEPGVGKSSLAKHVALLYQDLICRSKILHVRWCTICLLWTRMQCRHSSIVKSHFVQSGTWWNRRCHRRKAGRKSKSVYLPKCFETAIE